MNASSAPVHVVTVRRNEHLCSTRQLRAVGADPHHLPPSLQLQSRLSPPPATSLYTLLTRYISTHKLGNTSLQVSSNKGRSRQIIKLAWMDQQMDMEVNSKVDAALERSPSAVTYCCGACGYDLRLRSSDRNTAGIVGGYGRAVRRGVVAFDAIDDARFGHAEEFRCVDVRARRLFVRRTRLLCRKCGASLGFGYDDRNGAASCSSPRYDIRIRKLQPLVAARDDDHDGVPAHAAA